MYLDLNKNFKKRKWTRSVHFENVEQELHNYPTWFTLFLSSSLPHIWNRPSHLLTQEKQRCQNLLSFTFFKLAVMKCSELPSAGKKAAKETSSSLAMLPSL